MLIQATQLRPGMILEYNNGLWRVMAISHITPGNWRGMVQTKLRNVKTGTQTENRFRSEDRVERIILSQIEMEFLYQEGDDFHFMNTETFDQITIPKELIEDVVGFLTPNLKVEVEFHETTPLNVSLPKTVNLKVVRTDPGMRSAAVTNTLKPATMETGLTVQVPHFVQEGETITINTETREYMARAKYVRRTPRPGRRDNPPPANDSRAAGERRVRRDRPKGLPRAAKPFQSAKPDRFDKP